MEAVDYPPVVLDMGGGDGRHPDDGVHGSADFVAHAGKEVALGGVGLLCARQRVLERLPRLHLVGAILTGTRRTGWCPRFPLRGTDEGA